MTNWTERPAGDRGDIRADIPEDAKDTRWMSYGEIAQLRGTDTESAIRLVRRRKWPKRQANDGTVRVAIPADVLRDMSPRTANHLEQAGSRESTGGHTGGR